MAGSFNTEVSSVAYDGTDWVEQLGDVSGAVVTPTSSSEAQAESQAAQSRLGDWLASDLNNYAWAYG